MKNYIVHCPFTRKSIPVKAIQFIPKNHKKIVDFMQGIGLNTIISDTPLLIEMRNDEGTLWFRIYPSQFLVIKESKEWYVASNSSLLQQQKVIDENDTWCKDLFW